MSGDTVNYSKIGAFIGVSENTIRNYFDILEGTFLFRKVPSYSANQIKRVVKSPKWYVRDSGFWHANLGVTSYDALEREPMAGYSWEGFIIEEIVQGLKRQNCPAETYFYRTRDRAEVDLVIETNRGLLPIEIKTSSAVDPRKLKALKGFIAENKLSLGLVVSNCSEPRWLAEQIIELPAGVL